MLRLSAERSLIAVRAEENGSCLQVRSSVSSYVPFVRFSTPSAGRSVCAEPAVRRNFFASHDGLRVVADQRFGNRLARQSCDRELCFPQQWRPGADAVSIARHYVHGLTL